MERFLQQPCDPRQASPLTLAFLGDAVFELFVRERLVCQGNCSVNKLHKRAVEQVCCQAHVSHVPKNASPADYHAATALESLFGYVYLKGDLERLRLFFSVVCGEE